MYVCIIHICMYMCVIYVICNIYIYILHTSVYTYTVYIYIPMYTYEYIYIGYIGMLGSFNHPLQAAVLRQEESRRREGVQNLCPKQGQHRKVRVSIKGWA